MKLYRLLFGLRRHSDYPYLCHYSQPSDNFDIAQTITWPYRVVNINNDANKFLYYNTVLLRKFSRKQRLKIRTPVAAWRAEENINMTVVGVSRIEMLPVTISLTRLNESNNTNIKSERNHNN